VKFDALRRVSARVTLAASAIVSSVILGSCGGGGAASTPEVNGGVSILPAAASLYAGVGYTFQVVGGRAPYLLSSSEPVLLPVPAKIEGHTFSVVPNQPGVIDAGLPPGSLPIRSVVITVRDSFGVTISTPTTNGITVGQNFLTGYGVTITSTCTSGSACAGADAIVSMQAVTNGSLYGNRALRFCVVRGNYQFVVPEIPSNQPAQLVNCVNTTSDHAGNAIARIRVPANAGPEIATLRVIDVATGVYTDEVFTITAGTVSGSLTALPNDFTFTGPLQGVCGTGSGDFIVFDGTPPYTAVSSSPNIQVTPTSTGANPARFTITANNPLACVDNATVVVTDAANRRATVTVSTEEGSGTLPPLIVSPTTVTLNDTCNYSTSVTAVGGTGGISASSSHPRVTATVSGQTVTITRIAPDPLPLINYPMTGTVTITDGSTVSSVTVNGIRASCP
jgi:hypothetical protein